MVIAYCKSGDLRGYLLRYRNVLKAGVILLMSPLPFWRGLFVLLKVGPAWRDAQIFLLSKGGFSSEEGDKTEKLQ
jgi:hypothetical protein